VSRRGCVLLGCALLLAASMGPPGPAGAEAPLRVGASLSQTGPYGLLGQNQLRGYRLCVKDANAQGGVLGRPIELLAEDDRSDPATAARIYERLLTQSRVDAVLGPYSSPITDAVADLAERRRMPMVASGAAATSIFRKGRSYVFMVNSPGEAYLEGLIDMAARRGLKTVGVVHEDTVFPQAIAAGTRALADERGLRVVVSEHYGRGATDFSAILEKVRAADPDVVVAATYFDDAVAITRQLAARQVNPKMFGVTVGGDLPRFYERLGRMAEFVYGATQWEPELMAPVRAGGLIPVARRYPGAREFVEAYRKEFPGADLSYHSAAGYAGCQVLLDAIRRAGSLEGAKIRDAILQMDLNTLFGGFKVDADGVQIAHRMLMFQWQDGRKVIVWPDELATGQPRFPTPPWRQR
jgi:branched-chain amino acid transport system substrate-binding protein